MTAEQAIYEQMYDDVIGDTGASGLYNSSSAYYLSGGVFLADERPQNRALPRLMFSFVGPDRYDGDTSEISNLTCRIIIEAERNTAFGVGDDAASAGILSQLCDRVKTLFDGATLTPQPTGWSVDKLSISRGPYPGPSDNHVVRRIIEIPITACKS